MEIGIQTNRWKFEDVRVWIKTGARISGLIGYYEGLNILLNRDVECRCLKIRERVVWIIVDNNWIL